MKALRIADNRTADEGEWNDGHLSDELSDLSELGFTLDFTGFDPEELEELMAVDDVEAASDDDVGAVSPTKAS